MIKATEDLYDLSLKITKDKDSEFLLESMKLKVQVLTLANKSAEKMDALLEEMDVICMIRNKSMLGNMLLWRAKIMKSIYFMNNNDPQAIELLEKVCDNQRSYFHPQHLSLDFTLQMLGKAYTKFDKFAQAEAVLSQLLKNRLSTFKNLQDMHINDSVRLCRLQKGLNLNEACLANVHLTEEVFRRTMLTEASKMNDKDPVFLAYV